MNGATALDCENTISRPNNTKTMTIGTSQYFFSCFRNLKNSPSTRPLLIPEPRHLEHPVVVFSIAIARWIRRPPRPVLTAARQRIPAQEPPDEVDGGQHNQEQQRQPETSHHMAKRSRERPPVPARPFEQRRTNQSQ